MTKREMAEYWALLETFRGCIVSCSLACNSLKLHINREAGRPAFGYIWIDPEWTYSVAGLVTQEAESCPYAEEDNYRAKFAEWSGKMQLIEGELFLDYSVNNAGDLTLLLSDSQQILVPAREGDPELWYDHWYAAQVTKDPKRS